MCFQSILDAYEYFLISSKDRYEWQATMKKFLKLSIHC